MPLSFVNENNMTVIIALALISLVAMGIFFFFEKRFQQKEFDKVVHLDMNKLTKK